MRYFDFSPLFGSHPAFSNTGNLLGEFDKLANSKPATPYNIVKKNDDEFEIVIAAPGLSEEDIDISVTQHELTISSAKEETETEEGVNYLYKGFKEASINYRFDISENIKVVGATMDKGVLTIELVKEIPEALKPRSIKINASKLIEDKAA